MSDMIIAKDQSKRRDIWLIDSHNCNQIVTLASNINLEQSLDKTRSISVKAAITSPLLTSREFSFLMKAKRVSPLLLLSTKQ
jgi:hypothetical protein